jgi:peptidoglycan/LPS O-acetylase OafA/YrhL
MSPSSSQMKNQYFFVDFLKTIAVQIIIFHHLSNYGIIPLKVHDILPRFIDFIGLHGRYAVQIFLVIGGYLTAKSLPSSLEKFGLLKSIVNRYLRLVPAYMVAIIFTVICAAVARSVHYEEYIGEQETIFQIFAHFVFLQHILGFESISLGVWYVAIDWQLYIFIACLLYGFKSFKRMFVLLPIAITASLLFFSQHPFYEDYFIYFIGAYGLGIVSYLAEDSTHPETRQPARIILIFFTVLIFSDTFFELQIKNIIEIFLAILLSLFGKKKYSSFNNPIFKLCVWFSQRSYCAFLIHFSLLLLGNSLYYHYQFQSSEIALLLMLFIWLFSWIFAHILYLAVELPSRKIQLR